MTRAPTSWWTLAAFALLVAIPQLSSAAPVLVRWTPPTLWSTGEALPTSAIKHAQVSCASSATAPMELLTVVDGNPGQATIDIPADRWCSVIIYAEIAPGVLRQSDPSARALFSPKRPNAGSLLPGASAEPPNCLRGTTCPAP